MALQTVLRVDRFSTRDIGRIVLGVEGGDRRAAQGEKTRESDERESS
jgi:hypothetical protein